MKKTVTIFRGFLIINAYTLYRVSPAEVSRSVDKILPELLTKSGDTSTRIHHMAVHTILTMADCKNVR